MNRKKIIYYLLFVLIMLPLSLKAQDEIVTLSGRNITLKSAFDQIEKQTKLSIDYDANTINVNQTLASVPASGKVSAVLDALLNGTGYTYTFNKSHVIITLIPTPKTENDSGQTINISGIVTDKNGEAIIGANIIIKGTSNGTITDMNGEFTMQVPRNGELEISYIGYETKEVKIDGKTSLKITIEEDAKTLDEVVVVGYGTQQKKTLTGAVSMMDMSDMETGTKTSISQALAGKAAGLRVNQVSAQPGGGAKFRIRGESSIEAGNDPLIVIDGFPINSESSLNSGNIYDSGTTDNILASLNPEDIESISVLKDAASTAIYGARAGHGVILITTKRGQVQKTSITYSATGALQQISSNYKMLDVKSFMDMRNKQYYEEYLRSYGLSIYSEYITIPENTVIPKFQPLYTNDQINHAQGTNWLDEVTRLGYMHQHNLSLNGGTETTRYMASVNYMSQEGVVKNNGVSRFSARFNLDQEFNKYISIGFTTTYSQNKFNNVPLGENANEYSGVITAAIQANPANPIYDANGNYFIDPDRPFIPNAVSLLEITDKTTKDRFLGLAYVSIKPVKDFELKIQGGADRKFQKRSNYIPKTTLEGQKSNGQANISQQSGTDYMINIVANYSKTTENHQFKILGGGEYQLFSIESMAAGSQDFLIDGFLYNNLSSGSVDRRTVESYAHESSIASYFLRANYMYRNRYLIEATIRSDGASNFSAKNRWGYFPSVSAGWIISEEPFMENTRSWLSNLKLRSSFGQTGNSNVGYQIVDLYSLSYKDYVIGDTQSQGAYVDVIGNESITWETTTEFNLGMDIGLLKNRIRITGEYFNRRITDLLSSQVLLSYHEVDKIVANIGSTQSQGFEFTLNTANISTKNFEWNSILTLSHYNDRWLTRSPEWAPKPYEKVNDPIRAWWSYEAAGILRPGEAAPNAQKDLLPGMVIIKDQNNDGVIDDKDRLFVDNGDPDLYFGFSNTFRYKNFDLNIYFYGETGRKRGQSYYEDWTYMDKSKNVSVFSQKSFNSNNVNAEHPTFLVQGIYGWGDYYVKSIHFIRCGNITLGYNVPVKFAKSLRIYADVSNPFVITNWTGLDPETDNGSYAYPNIRSYNFGVTVTF